MQLSLESSQKKLHRKRSSRPIIRIQSLALALSLGLTVAFIWWFYHGLSRLNNKIDESSQKPKSKIRTIPPHLVEEEPAVLVPSTTVFDVASLELANSTIPARDQCLHAIRARQDEGVKDILTRGWDGKVLLVDPAYHANVGDHMITLAELQFLKRHGFKHILQCDYLQAEKFCPKCSKVIKQYEAEKKLAVWHGGGNWGDLWRMAQEWRVASLEELLGQGFTVMGMPQSLFYKNPKLEKRDALKLKKAVARGLGLTVSALDDSNGTRIAKERVILTWREEGSFAKAKELYPFCDHRLMPDIAFQLGPYSPIRNNRKGGVNETEMRDLLLLLRNDLETKHKNQRAENYTQDLLSKNDKPELSFRIVDWTDRLDLFHLSKEYKDKEFLFTDSSIRLLSLGRVLIVDRLHAAILAYLSGLPFVFVDQLTNKLTNTLNVAFDSLELCRDASGSQWERAESLEEAISKAIVLL